MNTGDLDAITFVGDLSYGTSVVVYENVGTKYHPEYHELRYHTIGDVYDSVCKNGFECTLTVYDYNRDGEAAL